MANEQLPEWIRIKKFNKKDYVDTFKLLSKYNLSTVCMEANCPNRYECFSKKTATFIILGDICTRNCKYCNIKKGIPKKVDIGEPERIAKAIDKLNIDYAVITCVTRDDLKDNGANQFTKTIRAIRKIRPNCKIEVLISDLNGSLSSLKKIIDEKPTVLNHNIEIVKDLFSNLRPKGNFNVSLNILKKAKEFNPNIKTKSGLMIGFGETKKQILETLRDLKKANCDIITIGQYLQPSKKHASVKKYYALDEFRNIKKQAEKIGYKKIIAGPLVRSSYNAKDCF